MFSPPKRSSTTYQSLSLSLALRHRHVCSRAEITHVSLSHTRALAVYAATNQPSQHWIDTSSIPSAPGSMPNTDTSSRRNNSSSSSSGGVGGAGLSKTTGSFAVFSPLGNLCAALRDWTVQLGGGVEFHHSSTILIRDVTSGKSVLEIKEANGAPFCWSSEGRLIAAGEGRNGRPERVGIWDSKTGRRVGRVVSHIDTVTHAAFAPASLTSTSSRGTLSSDSLVTLSRDGTLRITDPATSRTISRLEVDSHNPRMLAVSSRAITSIWGSRVHVWHPAVNDLTSYDLNSTRQVEGWPLCISPDCRYLACRTEDGFDIMELSSGTVLCSETCDTLVTVGAFSPDSRLLLLGRMDGVLEFWDISEGMEKRV